jgi:long-chain acyl-CoA synthetase
MTSPGAAHTLRDRITELCKHHPDAHAIEFEQGWTSWGEVTLRSAALRSTLHAAGVVPTDPVGVVVRDRPATVAALLSLLGCGQPVVMIQSLAADRELCEDVARLEVAAVVAEPREWLRDGFGDLVSRSGAVAVTLGDDSGDVAVLPASRAVPDHHPTLDPGIAVLVPTSGTSGPPRRHPLTTDTLDQARAGITVRDPEQTRGATIGAVPLSSVGGFMALVSTVWRGRPIALMERFDLDRWLELVREHRPRRIGVPPAIIGAIVERGVPRAWFDGVQCLTTGSAPLDPRAARQFADRYGIAVLNAYGATEFGGPVIAWRDDDWEQWNATKLGSAGRPLPGVDVRVASTDAVADDDAGVLEIRKHSGAWTPTSDAARIDADGFVWILGRVDDVIVRGGFKVRAVDVEEALATHEAVDEAVVVGIPDVRLGSVPAAMVTLRSGAAPVTAEELREHVRSRVAPYKIPVIVRIVDEIPRNAMMKPRRAHIRDVLGGET